jgi:uncharacterized membrane protein YiaA
MGKTIGIVVFILGLLMALEALNFAGFFNAPALGQSLEDIMAQSTASHNQERNRHCIIKSAIQR